MHSHNILLVEDECRQAELLAEILRDSEPPFEVRRADSLGTGVEWLASDPFDAVVLDLNLPDSRSLATLASIRQVCALPIVVFTAETDSGEAAVRAGADDYLVKGVAPPAAVHRAIVYAIQRRRLARAEAERTVRLEEEIAQRRRIEADLRASETRLRAILDNEPECVKIVSAEGRLLDMNPSGLQMIEAPSLESVLGLEIIDLVHPEDRRAFQALHRRVVAGESAQQQFRIIGMNGAERWMETHSVPLEVDGRVAVLSVTRDITMRRQVEDSLNRSQALLEMASRIGRVGAWAYDVGTNELVWSDEVRAIHEVPFDFRPTVESGIAFYAPEHRDAITRLFQMCVAEGEPFDAELQIISAAGRRHWVRVIGQAERSPAGDVKCVNGAFQDISAPKASAARNAELSERLTNTLETMSDAFLLIDNDWRVAYVNQEAERLLRRSRFSLLGEVLWQAVPEFSGTEFETHWRNALHSGLASQCEGWFAPQATWFEVRSFPSNEGVAVYFRDAGDERRARQALQESEEQLRTLAEAIPQLVWVSGADGRSVYSNRRWAEYAGHSLASARNDWTTVIHPDERTEVASAWTLARVEGRPLEVECRLGDRDGTFRWMLVRAVPLRNDEGTVLRWVGSCTDIAAMKAALEAAQASEIARGELVVQLRHEKNRFTEIFRQAPAFMAFARGPEHIFEYANDAYYSLVGWRTIIGRRVADALPEVVEQGFIELLDTVYASGQPLVMNSLPILLQREPGVEPEERFIDLVYHPLVEADGSVRGILVQGIDVTDRQAAASRLAQQAALIDETSDAIIVRDMQQRITLWSKGAEKLYERSASEAIGAAAMDILPDERQAFEAAFEQLLARGHATSEVIVHDDRGDALVVDRRWTLLRDESGAPKAVMTFDTDVTERRRMQQQLLRVQRMESIGTLAGGIAHDLNNLLMPILMGAGLLSRQVTGAPAMKAIRMIEQSALRGGELVNQILVFARGKEGERVNLRLNDVANEIQLLASSTFPRNIAIDVEIDEHVWCIEGDSTQLHQVLLNLCVNARDAMPLGGRLHVSAQNVEVDSNLAVLLADVNPGSFVRLAVVDEGQGIPPQLLERIFDPFFTTKAAGNGTGLGLSTVAAIVRAHGGAINVRSSPGVGTEFELFFPATIRPCRQSAEEAGCPRIPADATILVIEEDAAVRAMLQETLETAGYAVVTATDVAEATSIYANSHPAIALTISQAGVAAGGKSLTAALREIDPHARVILSTVEGNRFVALDTPYMLRRPCTADALLRTVHAALGGDAPSEECSRCALKPPAVPRAVHQVAVPARPAVEQGDQCESTSLAP